MPNRRLRGPGPHHSTDHLQGAHPLDVLQPAQFNDNLPGIPSMESKASEDSPPGNGSLVENHLLPAPQRRAPAALLWTVSEFGQLGP
jgi:hypothetical protein